MTCIDTQLMVMMNWHRALEAKNVQGIKHYKRMQCENEVFAFTDQVNKTLLGFGYNLEEDWASDEDILEDTSAKCKMVSKL